MVNDKSLTESILLGKKVQVLRLKKNMKVDEVAKFCGKSNGYIRTLESGARMPSSRLLIKLCECLDTTPDYLLGYYRSANQNENEIMQRIRELTPAEKGVVDYLIEKLGLWNKECAENMGDYESV
ncbi:helix-turn-helix domain-containing protein [Enterocloster clostridioformis]|uniref:helix-turn-helix domain-containing protein n=1 Tax=Enterocloster clostridioformis TaxID=1531 RepID=UPI00140A6BAE|nr:helix-turn-helix transcriptional regulator [Enterocloster clostridioformis]